MSWSWGSDKGPGLGRHRKAAPIPDGRPYGRRLDLGRVYFPDEQVDEGPWVRVFYPDPHALDTPDDCECSFCELEMVQRIIRTLERDLGARVV